MTRFTMAWAVLDLFYYADIYNAAKAWECRMFLVELSCLRYEYAGIPCVFE